jgi:D-hexose-6-phosphate mutarotase
MTPVIIHYLQGNTAEIYLHGAHVVSWKDSDGKVSTIES